MNITQNDVDDGPITPFREGYLDYMFGKTIEQNPFSIVFRDDMDFSWWQWQDGWNQASKDHATQTNP